MKNSTLLYIIASILSPAETLSRVWVVVEFLLYLVKDHQFNWYSVYAVIGTQLALVGIKFYLEYLKASLEKRKGERLEKELKEMMTEFADKIKKDGASTQK